ncbi:MAG: hypothetical protein HRT36_00935 [Alphaproteobacteria bacterium]|nr:hypothetical protein [Alphaproteobacteria bacterium]
MTSYADLAHELGAIIFTGNYSATKAHAMVDLTVSGVFLLTVEVTVAMAGAPVWRR